MKIAFNAIRVSNKAGSGFDTFIINFLNEFAKYIYNNLQLNIHFDIYTLYPHHFSEIKKENIRQIKIPFLKQIVKNVQYGSWLNFLETKISRRFLPFFIYRLIFSIYFIFADYFRMFWTQFIFPFIAAKYDVTVALTEYEGIYCKRKQIVIIHNTVPFLFPQFPTKYKFYTYKILPAVLRKCLYVLTVSSMLKEEITKILKVNSSKIKVIYEGVNTHTFHLASKHEIEVFKKHYQIDNDYILAVGHSHPVKNFDMVILSFLMLNKMNRNNKIDLIIAGYINKKIKIPEGVRYIGHIPNEQLYILYSAAKCFVFPTLHEGFGLPPLEAMACGCPVVVSNKGSLPEICGDAAVYVNPYDPQDIANGILKILINEDLRQQLIKKGFEQVKKFTWEKSVKKFVELLKSLENNGIN